MESEIHDTEMMKELPQQITALSKSGYGSEGLKYCRSQDPEEEAKGLRGLFIHMNDEIKKLR